MSPGTAVLAICKPVESSVGSHLEVNLEAHLKVYSEEPLLQTISREKKKKSFRVAADSSF